MIQYAENLATKSVEDAGTTAKTEKGRTEERLRERLRRLLPGFHLVSGRYRAAGSGSLLAHLGRRHFLEGRLTVIGKGGDQAAVRISERALKAIKEYLAACRRDGQEA